MEFNRLTLKEFFKFITANHEEYDLSVDGFDTSICVSGPIYLSDEAVKRFGSALDLYVEDYVIYGKEEDYNSEDGLGNLKLANELIFGLAGYCSAKNYDKWFVKY